MLSQPIHLISVNKTPARAVLLVGQLLESLKNEYDVLHVANFATIADLRVMVETLVHPPGILICSSQWSAAEQQEADMIARDILPDIKIIDIPPGLDVREGGEGIVKFLQEAVRTAGLPRLTSVIDSNEV